MGDLLVSGNYLNLVKCLQFLEIFYLIYFFCCGFQLLFLNLNYLSNVFMIKRVLTLIAFIQLPKYVDPLNVTAMACPAFPLCPLAITEAERGIPDILKRVRAVFEKVYNFI